MPSGFVFLPSYYDALKDLPDDARHQLYDAIMQYVFEGRAPELPSILEGYFRLMQPNIDASIKRYNASVENGKKGGRPPKPK